MKLCHLNIFHRFRHGDHSGMKLENGKKNDIAAPSAAATANGETFSQIREAATFDDDKTFVSLYLTYLPKVTPSSVIALSFKVCKGMHHSLLLAIESMY